MSYITIRRSIMNMNHFYVDVDVDRNKVGHLISVIFNDFRMPDMVDCNFIVLMNKNIETAVLFDESKDKFLIEFEKHKHTCAVPEWYDVVDENFIDENLYYPELDIS